MRVFIKTEREREKEGPGVVSESDFLCRESPAHGAEGSLWWEQKSSKCDNPGYFLN